MSALACNMIGGMTGRRTPVRRLLLTLFCILAFSFQGYIAQTHIHVPGENAGPAVAAAQAAHGHKQVPPDDPVRCPQCQLAFLAGAAVPPDALIFILPSHSFFSGYLAVTARRIKSVASHAWEIRGPPRA